ncbi:aldose 1-epimerase family protein [Leptotrichia wadei]|uniref:Aldose 1-epimerase n=1 Tax=Leptotrichia wadei (strain F0279) TaxID=888055 RepID=U2QDV2_LEPWF|nr:aldose 1-epimerase family protein [Leptotrichia wadei]ERK54364.1 aldose 1-epimerase [Leptotrichia wadei F0279]
MDTEAYVEYYLMFRTSLLENKNIKFENFKKKYIKDIVIKSSEDEENRVIRINLKSNFVKNKSEKVVLEKVDIFLMEFLHQLSLKMKKGLFPFYKLKAYKLNDCNHLVDFLETKEKLTFFSRIPENLEIENIDFEQNIEDYRKMIRILGIADSDPVTVFLVLYDWFLDWLTPIGKRKNQLYVIDYIRNHKEELEKPKYDGFLEYNFEFNEAKNREEDMFTKLRNDIGHSMERNSDFSNFFVNSKMSIKPLVYTMTYFLKNKNKNKLKYGNVEIAVADRGAELRSYKVNGEEFMWDRQPEFWAASSPVLFPFVGTIKNGVYSYNGKEYKISTRHGFARTEDFELVEKTENSLKFRFSSNKETLEKYPFEFELFITYTIVGNTLEIKYNVVNKNDSDMYFSLGTHPAFALDVNDDIKLSDYYLEFEKNETSQKYKLSDKGLVLDEKADCLNDENKLQITENVFDDDAIIFDDLKSEKVTIKNIKNSKKLIVEYNGFPYIAFWSKPKAPFVCIEPWYGISDFENTSGKLEEKIGILKLEAGEEFFAKLVIEGKK